jgi:hypothetical protein
VQVPGFIEYSRLIDGHPCVLAKILSPRRDQVIQTEQAGLIQALIEPALERTVPPNCSLNFLHQSPKLLSIVPGYGVLDRYSDRPVFVFRDDGQVVRMIERRGIDTGLSSEVD